MRKIRFQLKVDFDLNIIFNQFLIKINWFWAIFDEINWFQPFFDWNPIKILNKLSKCQLKDWKSGNQLIFQLIWNILDQIQPFSIKFDHLQLISTFFDQNGTVQSNLTHWVVGGAVHFGGDDAPDKVDCIVNYPVNLRTATKCVCILNPVAKTMALCKFKFFETLPPVKGQYHLTDSIWPNRVLCKMTDLYFEDDRPLCTKP